MSWRDIKAEMTRHDVTLVEVAPRLGFSYAKTSTIFASEDETQPLPAFAERVMDAIMAIVADRNAAASS